MGPLTRDEEVALIRRAKAGDRAAEDRLVVKHTGLVKSLIRPFRGRGVDYEDLVQVGFLELVVTVRRFDPERGTRLSTYATPRVRKALAVAVAKAERARLDLVDSYDRVGHPSVVDPPPAEALLLEDVEAACAACLTDGELAVLGMRYGGAKEMSHAAIALLTGRSKSAVGRTKRRAIGKLKRHLQPAA